MIIADRGSNPCQRGFDVKFFAVLIALVFLRDAANAATRIAASPSRADVQAAVDAAVDGDTVLIPSGSATWTSGIRTTKQIIIRAQSYTPTAQPTSSTTRNVVITYSGTTQHAFDMRSGNSFHCGVGGIKFLPPVSGSQGGSSSGIWGYVHFSGTGTKPPLLFDCHIVGNDRENVSAGEAAFLSIDSQGAVVWNTFFDGTQVPDGTSVAAKGMGGAGIHISSPRAWTTVSTMGTLDTGGLVNVYFEDCRWLLWGQSDVDDNGRLVMRESTMNGCSWQTHGFTSAVGGRHCEVYDCDFINTINGRNHSRYFWLRAGTVLFTDNTVSDQNTGYGTPRLLDIGDNTTPSGSYPVDRGPGRGHNGTGHVADPMYLWNNTGGAATRWSVQSAWSSQVALNRDIFIGTAKPSTAGSPGAYSKFTYPHPMRSVVEGGVPTQDPPTITAHPNSLTVTEGQQAVFTVAASGTTPFSFQWQKNQVNITGATSATYTIPSAQTSDAASYRCVVNNAYGFAISASATLTVNAPSSDTTPPSVPGGFGATPISSTRIDLSWTASTDNAGGTGVAGYRVERCLGTAYANLTQIAAPTGTSYSDATLSSGTTYSYRVRAVDGAGNLSSYSTIVSGTTQSGTGGPPPLPESNNGIAVQYANDANIGSHPDVLFADTFESYSTASQLSGNWSSQNGNIRIATESGNFFGGSKALEFTVPQQSTEASAAVLKQLSPEQDVLFLRYYAKFDGGYNVLGSSHNGASISANYCCPGERADGYNKFLVNYETARFDTSLANPGKLGIYIYHPDQRDIWGDFFFPTGVVSPFTGVPFNFGPYFVSRPDVIPQLGRWYCYEMMVKVNTPGQRDGRIALWLDGNLTADFQNLRLRETTALRIDKFDLDLYIQNNSLSVARKWYDNVVAAKSYIGPMVMSGQPAPPSNLRVAAAGQ